LTHIPLTTLPLLSAIFPVREDSVKILTQSNAKRPSRKVKARDRNVGGGQLEDHQTVTPKTASKDFQTPCVIAALRLCVKSLLHVFGLTVSSWGRDSNGRVNAAFR
jgi:hypothetical protein